MDQRYKITKMKVLMLILNFILVGTVLDCNASELSTIDHVNKTTIMRYYQEHNCVCEDGLVNDLLNLEICNIDNIFKCKDNYIKTHLKGITICEM